MHTPHARATTEFDCVPNEEKEKWNGKMRIIQRKILFAATSVGSELNEMLGRVRVCSTRCAREHTLTHTRIRIGDMSYVCKCHKFINSRQFKYVQNLGEC